MGLGFNDFTAGDVLTAAQVDGYLMRQSIMVFSSTSERDTALSGNLEEGMHCYTTDTNSTWVYLGVSLGWSASSTPWTAYTPAWTGLTVGNGVHTDCFYRRTSVYSMRIRGRLTFGTTTSVTGTPAITPPDGADLDAGLGRSIGTAFFADNPGSDSIGICQATGSGTQLLFAAANLEALSSTVPFTWATSDVITWDINATIVQGS